MRLTESELRYIIRRTLLSEGSIDEGFWDTLMGKKKQPDNKAKAKSRLDKLKDCTKTGKSPHDCLAGEREEAELARKNSPEGKLRQIDDEISYMESQLKGSMSREEKLKLLKKKAAERSKAKQSGKYYKDIAASMT